MACWNWRCVKDEKRGGGSEVYSGLLGGVFNMEINNVTEMGSSTLSKGLGTVWGWGTHLVAFCISKNFLLDLKFIEGDEKCSDPLTRPPFSLSLSLSLSLSHVYVIYCFFPWNHKTSLHIFSLCQVPNTSRRCSSPLFFSTFFFQAPLFLLL